MTNYNKIRNKIKDGDLIFFKSNDGLISKIIGKLTKSKYSHCAIAFWMHSESLKEPHLFIVEQFLFGRRVVKLSTYQHREFCVIEAPIQWSLYADNLLDGTGSISYSIADFFTIFMNETFNIKIKDFDGQVCSEMISKILRTYNIGDIEMISPGKLLNELLNMGHPMKVENLCETR